MRVPESSPPVAMAISHQSELPNTDAGFRCPFCRSSYPPEVKRRISTAGWVTFVVLLVLCFPLCLIGLFIKEDYRVCSSCGIKLG
jgi:LITAF-like zinc ribbon domain